MTTHYIRSADNETIVDIETTKEDIHSVVDLREFFRFLTITVYTSKLPVREIIEDFASLQEIRGEYWEGTGGHWGDISPYVFAKRKCSQIAEKYALAYLED